MSDATEVKEPQPGVKYPRVWRNKKSGQTLRVMPWWETIKDGEVEEVDPLGHMIREEFGRPAKFGVLVQIGYLLENESGCWFGVNRSVVEGFEDLGEWKKGQKYGEDKKKPVAKKKTNRRRG
jgi:hypothetical protein